VTAPDLNSTCRTIVDGRRAARMLSDWARRFDLSEPEFLVLWCLRDATVDGVDQTTIAQWLALSPAQVSATVERMNAQSWIVPHTNPTDRRRRLWQMSSSGRALWSSMLAEIVSLRQVPPGREVAA
jgi:DNA-binding MarR family transcriptional regulator